MFPASAGMNRHGKNGIEDPIMFPASAGMNRQRKNSPHGRHHVPRERGDEPMIAAIGQISLTMFPASAGMNR